MNETRARACSDYDLILNATTSRTGAAGRASVRAQAAAGAVLSLRRDNFIDNIKYGRNDFDYMRRHDGARFVIFSNARSRAVTYRDDVGRAGPVRIGFYQLTTFSL